MIKLYVEHCDYCTFILYENQMMLTLKCYTFGNTFWVAVAIYSHHENCGTNPLLQFQC